MEEFRRKSLREKCLKINLDPKVYGAFAEIGAGQEVVRNFFQVGAASGTVAKTMSAYDMVVSDSIYGREDSGRYVVESRLQKMIDREYDLLVERLNEQRGKETTFFSLANTVATTSYGSSKPGHGWMGVRFQHEPGSPCSQLVIHFRLSDRVATSQQYVAGALGVNMLYASFYLREDVNKFVVSLYDNIEKSRFEVDAIKVRGPAFPKMDDRVLSLVLLQRNLTSNVFFNTKGEIFEPGQELYKKHLLVLRGSFRPPTHVSVDMLDCGKQAYAKRFKVKESDITAIAEITMNNLNTWGDNDPEDFLGRVDLLAPLGFTIMVSNHERHYRMSNFFQQFTDKPVGMVMGYYNLKEMFEEKNYQELEGGILQSFGVLVKNEDKLFIYPYQEKGGELLTAKDLKVSKKLRFLLQHLLETELVVDIENPRKENLHIYSRMVLDMIQKKEDGWEEMVPKKVVDAIKKSCLFGYCEI